MKHLRFTQQGIVFAVFTALFVVFALSLRGFLTTANMLTLLQSVAVLGILGLAMAIVVIGRGIDISLIAALAVPPGLVLQMVQDGHSLPTSLAAAFASSHGRVAETKRFASETTSQIAATAARRSNRRRAASTKLGRASHRSLRASASVARVAGVRMP